MSDTATVGIIGSGLVASRVATILSARGTRPRSVPHVHATELLDQKIVVMAHGGNHEIGRAHV